MSARSGPSLPQSLLEELNGQTNDSHHRKLKSGNRHLSRKEARKQEREGRRQRKTQFFSSNNVQHKPTNPKRHAEHEHAESPQRKKAKLTQSTPIAPTPVNGSKPSISSKPLKPAKHASGQSSLQSEAKLEKVVHRSEPVSKKAKSTSVLSDPAAISRSRQEEAEDAYISYLESKLGYRKGGKQGAKYGKGEDDGLDDLFQDLDTIEATILPGSKSAIHELEEGSSESDAEDDTDAQSGAEEESPADEEEDLETSEEDASDPNEDEEWGGIQKDDSSDSADDDLEYVVSREPPSPASVQTSAATPSGRYVPPHLRNRTKDEDAAPSEAQLKLTRQLKGLLNRLSEQNIASIVDGVEEIYRNHRRHDVTSTLTTLIVDGISAHSMLLDSYVVLHSAFISALHKLVGIEFAAYFVQNSVASYEHHFAEVQNGQLPSPPISEAKSEEGAGTIGKEASNLIVLLSELYNFQVISCVLVYDIIRDLLDGDLTEFRIELLLKITRNSGQQLRQDDPTALKSIIQIVQAKLPSQPNAMSSRARFMVETLTNLKNNKVKNAGSTPGEETVERLKKFLSGLSKKRHVLSHEPLRVSLDDLHNSESKGKWWLVGAAWGGDPLVERQEAQREVSGKTNVDAEAISENTLLKLARKQGMNTDIRRGIFVVLMSSEDYVDACERLSQLKLTEVQQRETIRVILHCCGNETTYNPYYTLVGQQLCRTSHSHRITLQFCLWDFLRDLGETSVGGAEVIKNLSEDAGFDVKSISSTRLRNVARAYGWWIAKDCCTLAILKPVDFTVLRPQSQKFLKELLTQVFVSTQVSTPLLSADPSALPTTRNRGALEEAFIKATRVQNLAVGLVYFISETFRGKDAGDDDGFVKWASQVARDTLRTGMDVVAGL